MEQFFLHIILFWEGKDLPVIVMHIILVEFFFHIRSIIFSLARSL